MHTKNVLFADLGKWNFEKQNNLLIYYAGCKKSVKEFLIDNDFSNNELAYLTYDLEKYFDKIKLFQYNDPKNIKWIENALLREFALVLGNEKEKIKVSLYNDVEYLKAAELILDSDLYESFILPK